MTARPGWSQLRRPGRPTVFTVPPDHPFVDRLAEGLNDDAGGDPLALTKIKVLLPTRRSVRALRDAFLRLTGGRSLLLPVMTPLNDVGDDDEAPDAGLADDLEALPPPIDGLRRLMILTRLVMAYLKDVEPHRAVTLAGELARLLDQVETEQLGFERLADLVPADLARHWQVTVDFLSILTRLWPEILAEEQRLDPADHRNRALARRAAAWQAADPGPVVAAGSTGSIPATASLLATVATLPKGCVVLPGFDPDIDDETWSAIDEGHPHHGMKRLLEKIGVDRREVMVWPPCQNSAASARRGLVFEAMRPASTSERWQKLSGTLSPESLNGLSLIEAATKREEAAAIALAMRSVLEAPEKTCALVTPDRELAERVASELGRWNISIDDSAGQRLDRTPVGAFLCLLADMAAERLAPASLLSVCQHPLAAAGLEPADFRRATRDAEKSLLRGPRPAPGLDGLRRVAETADAAREVQDWITRLEVFGPFLATMAKPLASVSELLETHMSCAEQLAATPESPGPLRLWAGDAGEMAASLVADFAEAADAMPPIAPQTYPALFARVLATRVARPRYGRHPRLAILGPLEARLQRFDTVILGELNEGTWPATSIGDPWMSRQMRADFGLPPLERMIGLAAHDVAQGLCAPNVILTRALKIDGALSVPSRWLRRLEQVIAAAGLDAAWSGRRTPWASWSEIVDRPERVSPCAPPAVCPPVETRPRKLSVTQIETWMRDPYALYARHILKLEALKPLDQEPSAAELGSVLHRILEVFIKERPADAERRLIEIGRDEFSRLGARPGMAAFWWPRFERIAAWVAREHAKIGPDIVASFPEIKGSLTLSGPGGPFVITAKADRIDVRKNGLVILDYKTGAPPSLKEVHDGHAPQLPLEAAIAAAGGFSGVPARPLAGLEYWQLSGRAGGGEVRSLNEASGAAVKAMEGLARVIATFDQPETRYYARPNPAKAPRYSDYEHLARVREWSAMDDSDA